MTTTEILDPQRASKERFGLEGAQGLGLALTPID
jgi:hypothetical protein